MALLTDFESFAGDVVNLIPPQRAGRIARDAVLSEASGWCPMDPSTLESTLLPGVFLVGDSQARICGTSVRARLTGVPAPRPD